MINAEQARELGKVDATTIALAMVAIENDIKAVAAMVNTVLHTGIASVTLANGQTPSPTALMVRVKELLEKNGFTASFEVESILPNSRGAMPLTTSHRRYGIRISW